MALEKNYTTCEPFINCTADLVNTAETNTSHCQPQAVQDISELMLSSTGNHLIQLTKIQKLENLVSTARQC